MEPVPNILYGFLQPYRVRGGGGGTGVFTTCGPSPHPASQQKASTLINQLVFLTIASVYLPWDLSLNRETCRPFRASLLEVNPIGREPR
jgi:hypothetical protein